MKELSSIPLNLLQKDQFKMVRLQVCNWGTFSGRHDIPISEKGFLFVGPSGAGKSTLLDAFSCLLVPPKWIDFNAAARDASKSGGDRSIVSYIRGAWGQMQDEQSGTFGTRYLRPGPTWSALALSYKSTSGQMVVLVHLYWISGNSTRVPDVKRRFMIFERPFELKELDDFNFDDRKLKKTFTEAFIKEDFAPYGERFRRLLGIESETALRLLQKTQSAKSLGDLNEFLRNFMLEKPDTFAAADQLINEFVELNEAHQLVVTARKQIAILQPAKVSYEQWETSEKTILDLRNFRNAIEPFLNLKNLELIDDEKFRLTTWNDGLNDEEASMLLKFNLQEQSLNDLKLVYREKGGDQLQQWENEKQRLETESELKSTRKTSFEEDCRKINISVPSNSEEFARIIAQAKKETLIWQESAETNDQRKIDLKVKQTHLGKEFGDVLAEVKVLKEQDSNIPAEWLQFRNALADKLGIPEQSLPFVGELIEVRENDIAWKGAIERVLRSFALSILVDEKHYTSFSNYINSNFLSRRLVYHRMNMDHQIQKKSLGPNSMVHKLRLKEGHFKEWLDAELRQRFDFVCAESMTNFRSHDYSMTMEGLVRRGKSRHEKDDQFQINDKKRWVLGFNNKQKLELYQTQAQEIGQAISLVEGELEKLKTEEKSMRERALGFQRLMNVQWSEIDVKTVMEQISSLESNIKAVKKNNTALHSVEKEISENESRLKELNNELTEVKVKLRRNGEEIIKLSEKEKIIQGKLQDKIFEDSHKLVFEERISKYKSEITLDNIHEFGSSLTRDISNNVEELVKERGQHQKEVEKKFFEFKKTWEVEAADLDTSMHSAKDYFAKLNRLEQDGLPAYETRFFDLLRNQSLQNLTSLSTYLQQSRREITDKLELVNQGLSVAEFNSGTYLHIQPLDRQLPEVREFKQEVQQILSQAWTDDRELAETRFEILRKLVGKLNSQEAPDRRWKELVLDVRLHVEFIARERDKNNIEVEVYQSGSGKSGGQKQKLATTCLAAALRYQLGGHESGAPSYSPVILDEAFDKADPEFTALAMNIFAQFGFQMIVATPLKSVMTLEPFVGGACVVGITDRKKSGILMVDYDEDENRLKLPQLTRIQAREEV